MTTYRLIVTGRVQGVGFRPTVCHIARELGLKGEVRNLGGVAEIVCNAEGAALESFLSRLAACPPPIHIERITAAEVALRRFSFFRAVESAGEPSRPVLPADLAVCADCLREMQNKKDARYRYPFISCAGCGPRYTVIRRLPYDRARTTMDAFAMCSMCAGEYADMENRRCHGQTLSCPSCGPQLLGETRAGDRTAREDAVRAARALLESGAIIAVKAAGGYNLVCRADSEKTVRALRALKARPTKPFAVLFASMDELQAVCETDEAERALLLSPARPIVLLRRGQNWRARVCADAAGTDGPLGAFLPAFGLYALLAEGLPLIVTSCNHAGQPIVYGDTAMRAYFAAHTEIAGLFWNEREILRPADDAVARVVGGAPQVLRRTRGYLPEPLAQEAPMGEVLALGAEMEPAFCLASGGRYYPAAVPGDLAERETQRAFRQSLRDLTALTGAKPRLVVHDKHPLYFTTALAEEMEPPRLAVQHHHAHALSVMAEHGLKGPVLAVCFDGTGYGDNGKVWGGEFLRCEGADYTRAGHLAEVPLLGGDGSMRQGWKSALCHLAHAGLESADARFSVVRAALQSGVNTIGSSSMGRLFDAAAAVLGLCGENTHQGRCARALEAAAERAARRGVRPLAMAFAEADGVFDPAPLFHALVCAPDADAAALGFHLAVADMVARMAARTGIEQVVLAGGVFANRLLITRCTEMLAAAGHTVWFNREVPPGDGGLAVGQAYYGLLAGGQT